MSDICWTSHEWQEFTDKCIYDVEIFHDLVHRANDIYDNRVEKLLDSMTRIELYELPNAEPWQLETFLDKVKERCKEGSKELHKRSAMVEDAIEDLISLALEFKPTSDSTESELGTQVIARSPREEEEEKPSGKGRKHSSVVNLKGLDD